LFVFRTHAYFSTQNYYFACGFVWFRIFATDIKEEHKPRVLRNRALKRIFRLKRDEVTGEWRMRWAGHVARMGRKETRIDYWLEIQRKTKT
jgi:hypothetical protein